MILVAFVLVLFSSGATHAQASNSTTSSVSHLTSEIISAGSIYTEQTAAVLVMLLVILAISMQIARNYFIRVLRKFTLRLAADLWWLLYILLKDASIFLIVFLGFLEFWPGTYQDYPIAVPFQPLAIDLFAIALVIMLLKDSDEDRKWNNLITICVVLGGFLYIFGTVFITESAVALTNLPSTVSTSTGNFWGFLNQYFNSENNPNLGIYTFYITFSIASLAGLTAILSSFKNYTSKKELGLQPKPIIKFGEIIKDTAQAMKSHESNPTQNKSQPPQTPPPNPQPPVQPPKQA